MSSKEKNTQILQGYNPSQFKRMTVIFIALSLVNMLCVLFAFMRSGYGLYYAESALSHIAMVNSSVHQVNESTLDILVHRQEMNFVSKELQSIDDNFDEIRKESKEYLDIKLDTINEDLKTNFEAANTKIIEYEVALSKFTDELSKKYDENTGLNEYLGNLEKKYKEEVEPFQTSAEKAITDVFTDQNKQTYDFFVRCAQQFLFVLLFLIITMVIGLLGIRKMKKNARISAEKLDEEHKKAVKSREKTIDIAYTNILTGFKNRYGLEYDLDNEKKDKKFTVAVFKLVNFSDVNEKYGRSNADEYISTLSRKIEANYSYLADIFSTDVNEFCFVFKKSYDRVPSDLIMEIANDLSSKIELDFAPVKCVVAGCYFTYQAGEYTDCNSMLLKADKSIYAAKQNCIASGKNTILQAS